MFAAQEPYRETPVVSFESYRLDAGAAANTVSVPQLDAIVGGQERPVLSLETAGNRPEEAVVPHPSRQETDDAEPANGEVHNDSITKDVLGTALAKSIREWRIEQTDIWARISKAYEGASLFACFTKPSSFEISDELEFTTRIELLIDFPVKLRSGRDFRGSARIPAYLTGHVDLEKSVIVIDSIALPQKLQQQ